MTNFQGKPSNLTINDNLLKTSINNTSSFDEGGQEVVISEPSTTSCLVKLHPRTYEAFTIDETKKC